MPDFEIPNRQLRDAIVAKVTLKKKIGFFIWRFTKSGCSNEKYILLVFYFQRDPNFESRFYRGVWSCFITAIY